MIHIREESNRNIFQGLLKFAMEATKGEDAPCDSTMAPMDQEVRRIYCSNVCIALRIVLFLNVEAKVPGGSSQKHDCECWRGIG